MSPLAAAIYDVLRMRVPHFNCQKAMLTQSEMLSELGSYGNVGNNLVSGDAALLEALSEIASVCRENRLPALSALVVSATNREPHDTYYLAVHGNLPNAADRRQAWQIEVSEVCLTTYPKTLQASLTSTKVPDQTAPLLR